ncbi:hypothetical protein [Arthrobacter sp. C9C5]|uniref:hypothetical protein n=1 Tax=Arthrobacter sp. C9C5 TaxID=2735267 RepID=UPI0032E04CD4
MQRAGPVAVDEVAVAGDAVAAPPDAVVAGLAELVSLAEADGDVAVVAPWDWLWGRLWPQPLSSSATAAAAVTEVITSLFFIC